MLLNFLITISATFSLTFIYLKNPLTMAIMLVIQTIMIGLISSVMVSSFWYSYMLILMIVSGLLILFMYMASIASNEKFTMKLNPLKLVMLMLMVLFMYQSEKTVFSTKIMEMVASNEMVMNKLFNYKLIYPTLMMIMILFLMMVVISFLVDTNEGPMRKSN